AHHAAGRFSRHDRLPGPDGLRLLLRAGHRRRYGQPRPAVVRPRTGRRERLRDVLRHHLGPTGVGAAGRDLPQPDPRLRTGRGGSVRGELRRLHHLPGPVRDRADFRLWPVRGLRAAQLRVRLPPGARDQGPRARGHGRSATGPSRQEPQLLTRGAPGPGSSPWPPDPLVSRPAALRERPSDLWNTLSYEAAPEVAPRGRTGF